MSVCDIVGHTQLQHGFHHKWYTGITVNVLCSDNTVSNYCYHKNRMVEI